MLEKGVKIGEFCEVKKDSIALGESVSTTNDLLNELVEMIKKDISDLEIDYKNGHVSEEFKEGCVINSRVIIDCIDELKGKYNLKK